MPLYIGKDIDLLIAAINRDNPQMTWKLTATDFIYSKPVKYTVANQLDHNTQIRITAKESSPYRGNVVLTYRRIDLAVLFRSQRMELKKFVKAGSVLTKQQSITLLNAKYGLNLDPTVLSMGNFNGNTQGQQLTITMGDLSYQYVGAIVCYWTQDLEELGLDILTTGELAGAVWPNNIAVFDPEGTYPEPIRHEFLPLFRDFTEDSIVGAWPIVATQASFVWSAAIPTWGFKTLLEEINAKYGLDMKFEEYNAITNPRGIYNRTMGYRFMPINAAAKVTYPFLNRDGATHVLLLWFTNHPLFGQAAMGFLPFYYNV